MNLEEKSRHINDLLTDLRAEYVAFYLQSEGLSQNAIQAIFEGPMKRKWSTDIDRCETESFEDDDEALTLHLNRMGIYDALPEALFHQMPDSRHNSADEMAKDSMRLKQEEKNARLFFRVFENEIFRQRVDIVDGESRSLENIYSGFLDKMIPGFWKIDGAIPEVYASRLLKYLPVVHKISGNYELTALCLESILEEKVVISLSDREPDETTNGEQNEIARTGSLGRLNLGSNMILGNEVSGFIGKIIVEIGPLTKISPLEFFQDGALKELLACFYGYFFPVEFDVEMKLISPGELNNRFILSSETEQSSEISVLGYSTAI